MAEKLTSLKKQRGLIKSSLTRFKTFLDSYDSDHREVLKIRLEKAKTLLSAYEEAQLEIELIENTSDEASRQLFEETYFEYIARGQSLLTQGQTLTTTSSTASNPTIQGISETLSQLTNSVAVDSNIKLPTISLPKFDGNYNEWLSFEDSFNALVHSNPRIQPVQKFNYLKSCLSGNAAQVIQSLSSTAESYDIAWKLLTERFSIKRIIIQSHVRALFELTTASKESISGLNTLIDTAKRHIQSLNYLGQPTDQWNALLLYLITSRLDKITQREWENSISGAEMPDINDLWTFLRNKCHVLEAVAAGVSHREPSQVNKEPARTRQVCLEVQTNTKCHICSENHNIFNCETFKQLNHSEKIERVKRAGLCFNCLRSNHQIKACRAGNCRKCNQKHNTMLHFSKTQSNIASAPTATVSESQARNVQATDSTATRVLNSRLSNNYSQVILSTAVVDIVDSGGQLHSCRVVLDAGSQSNFISERLCDKLNLTKTATNVPIQGIGDLLSHIKFTTNATIKSRSNAFSLDLQLLVITNITTLLPSHTIERSDLEIPENIILADPEFYKPSYIDILIGAEHFYHLLCVGQIKLKNQAMLIHKTRLGWVVAGKTHDINSKPNIVCNFACKSLDSLVQQFWEIEELPTQKILSRQEAACEDYFVKTVERNDSGRYSVSLPFNEKKKELGDSFKNAVRRFYNLERRLVSNPETYEAYRNFLQEYKNLGHMTEVLDAGTSDCYFIPHHAVLKDASLTTKLRVVFDASARTTTGISLNDTLLVGPVVQSDIFSILTRFRIHNVVFTADIEKMYRQFEVHARDRSFQRILWRDDKDEPLRVFELNTLTYGTSSAPFLATRTLMQLAKDEHHRYPRAAKIVSQDMYVDDLLSGAKNLEQALILKDEITQLLQSGGLHLRKWASNDPRFIDSITNQAADPHLSLSLTETQKTLGIYWNPQQDTLTYRINMKLETSRITKRVILSQIATLFDPLGLLGPIIVAAKIFLQKLWKLQLTWDANIPPEVLKEWKQIQDELPFLNQLAFARQISIAEPVNIQLHGFADASENAYGACIFIRSSDNCGTHLVNLVCSKSRVAPLKKISLPKLELCAALLLARLLTVSQEALKLKLNTIILWSDSTIALQWIHMPPHRLKTFVANRITEIQQHTRTCEWRHVSSADNPADLVSRGLSVKQLMKCSLWKHGPSWLASDEESWPKYETPVAAEVAIDVPELRTLISLKTTQSWEVLHRFSSITTFKRTLAWCYRFINNSRDKAKFRANYKPKFQGNLSSKELQNAMTTIIKLVQQETFPNEIRQLEEKKACHKQSKLLSLNPFLDSDKILRVGGRLKHSNLSYNQKHPVILPEKHNVTDMIIKNVHDAQYHAGPQATLYAIRQNYWLINGKNRVRKIIHNCITCFRVRPQLSGYLMGNLPKERFESTRPFSNTGVDYCGPFLIKEKKFRNRSKIKIYVAIFICLSSKAVHLEIVSDLTTEAFCAALRRFFSRRGKSNLIMSDNATNFVGAKNYLQELYEFINSEAHKQTITRWLGNEEITWKFIPPRSPHFGGLWEAAVKSFKFHLFRIIKDTLFTFEQFNTLTIEIEAVLNSRPLTSLSQNPEDLIALTPSHFLIGSSLYSVPEPDFSNITVNRLSAWQHIQKIKRDFWKRWQKEYLNELNQRSKWKSHDDKIFKINDLVLIKEDNVPPLCWPLGRIVALHPGADNIIRVVTIKTAAGVYKRNVRSLALLPIETNN